MKKEKLMKLLEYVFDESRDIHYGRCGDWEFIYDDLDDLCDSDSDVEKLINEILSK